MSTHRLDPFTRAYIESALWSSTVEPYQECSSCGKGAIMCQYDTDGDWPEWSLCSMCGGDPQGNSSEPPADQNYTWEDFAPATQARFIADCEAFQTQAESLLGAAEHTRKNAGHDFWLTRNGHGAGFWDGDWPEPQAEQLTELSKTFGTCYLYVGGDGKLYV